jgi:hypothetical protein
MSNFKNTQRNNNRTLQFRWCVLSSINRRDFPIRQMLWPWNKVVALRRRWIWAHSPFIPALTR